MKIVIDTNVAIAALLRDSIVRKLFFNPALELYSPDHMFGELEDPDDLPFAASAMALSDFEPCWLWSYDPHFLDKKEEFSNVLGIKIVTTKLIYHLLNK